MADVVSGETSLVSDGETARHVYDRHIIKDHPTIKMRTRRGLEVEGSVTHRVRLADKMTWKRLDELAIGETIEVSGGSGRCHWPTKAGGAGLLQARSCPGTLHDVAADAGVVFLSGRCSVIVRAS